MDFEKLNKELADKDPIEIVKWAFSLNKKVMLTTNFGPHEAAIIHMAVSVDPNVEVIWIDSGYNTEATYKFAHKLIEDLKLNIKIYSPIITKGYRDIVMNGTPGVDDPNHEEFTKQVKLEPFNRALSENKPEVWLTAIRKDQTLFRGSLDVISEAQDGIIKVAPIFYWNLNQLEDYINQNNLPIEKDYHDPTKVDEKRECGLHLSTKPKTDNK